MGYVPALAPARRRRRERLPRARRPGTRREVKRLRGQRGEVYTPGFSADGRLMAAVSGLSRSALCAAVGTAGRPRDPLGNDITDMSLSPDGRTLAVTRPPVGLRRDPRRAHAAAPRDAARLRDRVGLRALHARRALSHGRELEGLGAGCGRPRPRSPSAAGSPGTPGASSGRRSAPTAARWPPAARTARSASGTCARSSRSAPRCRGCRTGSSSRSSPPTARYLFAIYGDGAGRAYRWDVRPSSWARHACEVAGRPLTRAEWRDALPGRDYDPAC